MKGMAAIVALVVLLALPGIASAQREDGYFGCLVNQSGGMVEGQIKGFDGTFSFAMDGNRRACMNLPEGDYTAESSDGLWQSSFTVSPDRTVKYGDRDVYWLQYVTF